MTTSSYSLTGGCSCGALRYQATAQPVAMLHCHCRDCQRASGGPLSSYAIVPVAAFTLVQGTPRYYGTASELGGCNQRGFCADCGTPVLAKPEAAPHLVALCSASLDDTSAFRPQMDVWTCDAQPWEQMDPALPKFEKYPS